MNEKHIKDGGPAFPGVEHALDPRTTGFVGYPGMSLRDYFAAKALPVMYRAFYDVVREFGAAVPEDLEMGIARNAYKLADAMLKAREASNE